MRLSKFQVVAILSCLLITGSNQAQFGKLKSLAKDKLGLQPKSNATNTEGLFKGPSGEAKAMFAPGVKKTTVNVSRQSGPSPEARAGGSTPAGAGGSAQVGAVEGGRSQVVSLKVSQTDARQFDSVRGYGPCNKVTNFQILSATQMKVTLDLSGTKSGGTCSLYFRSGGDTLLSANVTIKAKK